MKILLCKNCEYYLQRKEGNWISGKGKIVNICRFKAFHRITGKDLGAYYDVYCEDARNLGSFCGEEGKCWEEKL